MKTSAITKTILFSVLVFIAAHQALASETNGTITSGGNNGYSWSNQAGWINFGCSNCGISITDSGITGYAWNNNYGWINMKPTNGGVTVAANGALSGYAWGSSLGWINFSGVSINSLGKFIGQATGAVIGMLTFDCDNCDVRTDYRPANLRMTTATQSSGGGGGGGGGTPFVFGPNGQIVPSHVNAFNVPMELYPTQSGTLTQNLSNQKSVILDTPSNIYSDDITFSIKEEAISSNTVTPNISVIGNILFSVTAWDRINNPVHTFLKPVKITLTIPELLRGRSDLGVYFFDETSRTWVKIPDAVFSGDSVSFSVDHLTLFAIFAGSELSPTIEAPFQLSPQFQFEIQRGGVETSREGVEVPAEEVPSTETTSEEKPPLFDIEVSPGPSESKRARVFVLIAVLIIAAAGATFYFLRRMKKNQQ